MKSKGEFVASAKMQAQSYREEKRYKAIAQMNMQELDSFLLVID